MDVTSWFLHVSPSGLQKVARRNCASSLVEQAAAHAQTGMPAQIRIAVLEPAAGDSRRRS